MYEQEYFSQQLVPQSFLGGLLRRPLSDSLSCGPYGSLGQRIPALGFPVSAWPASRTSAPVGSAMQPLGVGPAALPFSSGQTTPGGYVPQLMLQSFLGGLLGRRWTDSYGCGPSGSLGQRNNALLPFGVDPLALAYAQLAAYQQQQQQQQQQQLVPQGWLG